MAGLKRTVHPQSNIVWAELKTLAPDIEIQIEGETEPMALGMVDPDGETHVYVFSETGREALLRQLTGGIVVPKGVVH
jgi:hypothetical protein